MVVFHGKAPFGGLATGTWGEVGRRKHHDGALRRGRPAAETREGAVGGAGRACNDSQHLVVHRGGGIDMLTRTSHAAPMIQKCRVRRAGRGTSVRGGCSPVTGSRSPERPGHTEPTPRFTGEPNSEAEMRPGLCRTPVKGGGRGDVTQGNRPRAIDSESRAISGRGPAASCDRPVVLSVHPAVSDLALGVRGLIGDLTNGRSASVCSVVTFRSRTEP